MLFQTCTLLAVMAATATATVCPGSSDQEVGAVWAVFTGASVNPWTSGPIVTPFAVKNNVECAVACQNRNGDESGDCHGFEFYPPDSTCRLYGVRAHKIDGGNGDVALQGLKCDQSLDAGVSRETVNSCCEIYLNDRKPLQAGGPSEPGTTLILTLDSQSYAPVSLPTG